MRRVPISAIARNYRKALAITKKLGLPPKLLFLLCNGLLEREVERAQAEIDRLNALLDEWEKVNPEAAALAPWAQTRQAWKDAGRPHAEWYEVIQWSMPLRRDVPLRSDVLERQVYAINWSKLRMRQRQRANKG